MALNLNITQVVGDMLQAALPHLSKGKRKASAFASHEFEYYIYHIEHIKSMLDKGQIDEQEAQFLVNQYKMSMQAVLLTIDGLGLIAVQNAINAAVNVLNSAIRTALGTAYDLLKFEV